MKTKCQIKIILGVWLGTARQGIMATCKEVWQKVRIFGRYIAFQVKLDCPKVYPVLPKPICDYKVSIANGPLFPNLQHNPTYCNCARKSII